MELKAGYKQTEIGFIPQDWEALPASQIGRFRGGAGFPLSHQGSREGDFPFYKVSDMNNDGNEIFMAASSNWISEDVRRKIAARVFPAGSIVFAKVGAAIFLERKKILSRPSCIDNNMAAFVINDEHASVRFFHSQLLAMNFGDLVATTALPSLSGKVLGEMVLAVPPIPEQSAIANALSDVDALLAAQDALIAKKRAIKQGAMQELLTGKRRLPGFSGEWEVKNIGEFTDCTAGGTPSTFVDGYWGGSIRWMNSGELNLRRVREVEGRITEAGLKGSSTKIVPAGCVLIGLAGQGRTRGTVAINYVALCTNQSIAAIFPNETYSSEYLYQHLDTRYDELRDLSSGGGGRGGLNLTIIRSLEIPFPSIEEQSAVAKVLSDIDTEITALESKRTKTAQLKQGMMQALLTGRIRLV